MKISLILSTPKRIPESIALTKLLKIEEKILHPSPNLMVFETPPAADAYGYGSDGHE